MAAVIGGIGTGIIKGTQVEGKTLSRPISIGTIVDAIAVPTLIAMGILGALGVVALSPAASYVMIGVGAACAVPHLALFVISSVQKANPLFWHKEMFKDAWGSEQA